jgi:hypothetical protein
MGAKVVDLVALPHRQALGYLEAPEQDEAYDGTALGVCVACLAAIAGVMVEPPTL